MVLPRLSIDRWPLRVAVALPLLVFAAYGMFSFPGLWADWHVPASAPVFVMAWIAIAAAPLLLIRRQPSMLMISVTVAVMAIVAIGLRIAIAEMVDGRIPLGDARNYVILGQHLLEGRGLVIFDKYMGIDTRALYPPLYAILLAAWGAGAGFSTASLTVLATLVDLATAAAMIALARALGNARAGIAAGWLYLVWPSVLLSVPLAQKEGVCALLAVLLALQWVSAAQGAKPGWRTAAGLGLTAGSLALTQPGEAPLAVLFGLVAATMCGWRPMIAVGLRAALVAIAAVLMPWWIRNAVVLGSFVPLTSAGGYGLWIGNNPDATGHWMPPPPQLYGMPEIAFGKAATALALDWIVHHPGAFVRITLAKTVRAWGVGESGASRLAGLRPAIAPALAAIAFVVSQIAHFGLLGGAALAARIRRTPGAMLLLLLVLACVLQTLIFGVWFEFGERHRDFATPFLLLLGVFGLAERRRGSDVQREPRLG